MNYQFPTIDKIDSLLDVIKDRKEYIHVEKQWYDIINYVVMSEDTFPAITSNTNPKNLNEAILLRECRGVAFDKKGNILSRPFHKFFNLNERMETQSRNIDFNRNHSILLKLDGSMIRPLFNAEHNGFRLATKMGVTDVAFNAEIYVSANPKYFKFFRYCNDNGLSPTFEWVSQKNRIVVNYPQENLILTAIRNLETGSYMDFHDMEDLAGRFDIPAVAYWGTVTDISKFLVDLNEDPIYKGLEGFVVRFDNGHMLKVKTDEYLIQHKSKDIVSSKRRIIEFILDEKIDDLKPRLIPEDLDRVISTEKDVAKTIKDMSDILQTAYNKYGRMDRKNFATNVANNLSPFVRKGVFSMMDGHSAVELTKDFLLTNVKNESKLGNLKSQYNIFTDV